MAQLEIIGTPVSNYVRTIRMLCEEKGVVYALNPSLPHTPEVKALHPAGQVPCMRHDGITLFESKAIAHYIDNRFPGPKFFPADVVKAAQVEQWVSYVNGKVDRCIMREFVVPSLYFDKTKGPETERINATLPEIERYIAPIDKAVATTGYLVGDTLTYADLNVLPMLAALTLFPATSDILAKFGALSGYVAKHCARPSLAKTAPTKS
jgi:glutathione S-transferase